MPTCSVITIEITPNSLTFYFARFQKSNPVFDEIIFFGSNLTSILNITFVPHQKICSEIAKSTVLDNITYFSIIPIICNQQNEN